MYEIRCPLKYKGRITKPNGICNHLCGRVSKLSQVELRCQKCKKLFYAITNEDGVVTYF